MKAGQAQFYGVFVRGHYHLIEPWHLLTSDRLRKLERLGFVLIWDSATTIFRGTQYAAHQFGAPVPFEIPILNRELTRLDP